MSVCQLPFWADYEGFLRLFSPLLLTAPLARRKTRTHPATGASCSQPLPHLGVLPCLTAARLRKILPIREGFLSYEASYCLTTAPKSFVAVLRRSCRSVRQASNHSPDAPAAVSDPARWSQNLSTSAAIRSRPVLRTPNPASTRPRCPINAVSSFHMSYREKSPL